MRKTGGWALLVVGVAGCVLPVIPGIPLLLAGLLVLAQDYLWAKRSLHKTKRWAVHVRRKARAKRAGAARTAANKSSEKV
ncbi:MAG: hypothetical protein JST61_09880 [Acidobacteria bacterium]|nr:hypothetical protein [Acidobacteriota bacterium]